MSSHLRHCPKHRKPLPCAHCALTAKPAPETLEPASVPEVRITRCEPGKANAKSVPRSMISAEVRRAIDSSLSAVPAKNASVIQLETVETSTGTKTLAAAENGVLDIDDAAEQGFTDKNRQKNTRLPAASKREPAKQPAYLKSVAQPLVPSTNPAAPYGFDDNDRPIGVFVPKPSLVPSYLPKSNEPAKPHKFSKSNLRAGSLAPGGHNGGRLEQFVRVISESEATLRRLFGERIPDGTIVFKPSKRHHEFVDYRKMFQLTRTELATLLDTQIYTERVDVFDTTQPKQKILKSSGNLKQEINVTGIKISDAEKRIEEIGDQIKESEKLVDSWSVTVMKAQVKRGERQPDDILDKSTREKFKYQERQKVTQLEDEYRRLRQQLNQNKQRLAEVQEHFETWGLRDEDYDMQYPRVTREYPVHFRDKFVPPNRDEFKGILPPGYGYGANGYAQVVYELSGEHETSGEDKLLRHWRQFENELVLQLIGWRLIQPSLGLLKKHPTLTTYLDMDTDVADRLRKFWANPAAAMSAEPKEIESDDTENALIFKTGGAQIGGQIYSAGTRWNGTQRSLSSFDGPIGRGTSEAFEDSGNDYTSDLSSDDSDSYQPD